VFHKNGGQTGQAEEQKDRGSQFEKKKGESREKIALSSKERGGDAEAFE